MVVTGKVRLGKDRIGKDRLGDSTVESDEPIPTHTPTPIKQKYGEYQHVLLTSDEFNNLSNDFGKELIDKAVKFLDEYIEEKGYESNSHCLTIRRWVIDAVKEHEAKQNKTHNNKTNQFNNFSQRNYSTEELDALERRLLGCDQKEVAPLTEEELKEAEVLKQVLKEKYGKGSS